MDSLKNVVLTKGFISFNMGLLKIMKIKGGKYDSSFVQKKIKL